jgi:cysteine desulfurase family protein
MIYFDNGATSYPKPKQVEQAVAEALHMAGNAGRGAYGGTLDCARMIFGVREQLAELFHIADPSRIAFTSNATESLNIAIGGMFAPGDHVVTTVCEHNSVLRPLYLQEQGGVHVTYIGADSHGVIDYDALEQAVTPNTKAIVVTHASNLTGNLTDLNAIKNIKRKNNTLLVLDSAQTAGAVPIDVEAMDIDVLCFTGHKGLMGPQGTGGIYVREGVALRPLKVGGSGVHSYEKEHPAYMPTALEAGTLNGHGIAGLGGALSYIASVGVENIGKQEMALTAQFLDGVSKIDGITVYGETDLKKKVGIVSLNVRDVDSAQVADWLWEDYEICVRAGAHCAPRMHEALGTTSQGAVRFSFSHFNTEKEVEIAIEALRQL